MAARSPSPATAGLPWPISPRRAISASTVPRKAAARLPFTARLFQSGSFASGGGVTEAPSGLTRLTARYHGLVTAGEIAADPGQLALVRRLDAINQGLAER